MFDPGLKIGQILKNADIVDIFKCGNMGGMRRSKTTNTLVIVSDYTTANSFSVAMDREDITQLRDYLRTILKG